ncbi:hypothetical protein GWI33_022727 [Rhynchophorus ferrugineus]|uniref:Uncharacterized protein n=1 Tax=Rhynchophorus ferrugineus TaxID=354439 RepID=A0A834IQ72_RHYFE|nr:hypothetical protein GWI33_022727 [Rhynchophorus ferrugineus]
MRLVEMEDYTEREPPRCPTPSPPPPYESVVMSEHQKRMELKSSDSTGLPSYEAALRSLNRPIENHNVDLA